MSNTTIEVSEGTYRMLQELSEQFGISMQRVLDQAIQGSYRRYLQEQTNAGYAALRANQQAWQEELAERRQWESTLGDGEAQE